MSSPRALAGKAMAAAKRRAEQLPSRSDGLVWRFDGKRLLAHRVAALGPSEVMWANYEDVFETARRVGCTPFAIPVPDDQPLRVGVPSTQWEKLCHELATGESAAGRRARIVNGGRVKVARSNEHELAKAKTLRVFTPVSPPGSSISLGERFGIDVERWDVDDSGGLRGPRANLVGNSIPADLCAPGALRMRGRDLPSLVAFEVSPADQVQFDIDVVYTWVDGDDPAWIARRGIALGAIDESQLIEPADRDARYRQRDELRYSLRSLRMYAPWVRHVWIVTDDQTPNWLDLDSDWVTLVSHRDIWPSDGVGLPTFNSHAIESRLHHIEGLAEHFIYMNDDFLIGRPVNPESFFFANGLIQTSLSTSHIPPGPPQPGDTTPTVAGKNIRTIVERDFRRTVRHRLRHTPYPMRRSVMFELEERYPQQFAHLRTSQFRNSDDVAPISFCHHYAHLTGRAVPGDILCRYVELEKATLPANISRIETKESDWDTLCLNDAEVPPEDAAWVDEQLNLFLQRRFPVASDFELVQ